MSEIIEQVREHGFNEPPAPHADPDAFDPLACAETDELLGLS